MITNSKDLNSPSRQQGSTNTTLDHGKATIRASSSSSLTTPLSSWTRLKDPRIVRVSRAFGGKDRHSKVCTIRGLRDRRVRLSVPTAIQLYDLQDRLGLNQPSKVVDWLLNIAKNEIDELPPLPISPENFNLNHLTTTHHEFGDVSGSNKEEFKIGNSLNWEEPEGFLTRTKSKDITRGYHHDSPKQNDNEDGVQVSSSTGNFLNVPAGSYYHLEPSIFHGFASQTEDSNSFNLVPFPSALSLSSGGPQVLVCPTQPLFPTSSMEIDIPRQINHYQMMHSGSSSTLSQASIRPFHFSRVLHSDTGHADREQESFIPYKR